MAVPLLPVLVLLGCHPKDTDTAAPAPDLADLSFDAFELWATPLQDYLAAGEAYVGGDDFLRGVHDLAVFDGRLYLGYGDANLNLGRVFPIEIRSWQTPDADALQAEFTTDEEQVDLYRPAGDLLLVPGVDATEDGFLGNAYVRTSGGDWVKSRTLDLAWHVHDMARIGDTLWACGSGGLEDDYNNSTVRALLFRSDDGGVTFETAWDLPHPSPPGDQRFTSLLAVGETLYVFGYISDLSSITDFHALALVDDALVPVDGLERSYVTWTEPLGADVGLAGGLLVGFSAISWLTWRVTADGVAPAAAFEGRTVIDTTPLPDGRVLALVVDGDVYPMPDEGPWSLRVGLTSDGDDWTELVAWSSDVLPEAVAGWEQALYLGLDDGTVWWAEGR